MKTQNKFNFYWKHGLKSLIDVIEKWKSTGNGKLPGDLSEVWQE